MIIDYYTTTAEGEIAIIDNRNESRHTTFTDMGVTFDPDNELGIEFFFKDYYQKIVVNLPLDDAKILLKYAEFAIAQIESASKK
jgi:hypothetical protein